MARIHGRFVIAARRKTFGRARPHPETSDAIRWARSPVAGHVSLHARRDRLVERDARPRIVVTPDLRLHGSRPARRNRRAASTATTELRDVNGSCAFAPSARRPPGGPRMGHLLVPHPRLSGCVPRADPSNSEAPEPGRCPTGVPAIESTVAGSARNDRTTSLYSTASVQSAV